MSMAHKAPSAHRSAALAMPRRTLRSVSSSVGPSANPSTRSLQTCRSVKLEDHAHLERTEGAWQM
jgi:hypothetical protein